jgi:hypothetical protein
MIYRALADGVLVLHLAFIVFATLGGALVWRQPRWAWLHLPALAWGAYVVLAGTVCPLTPIENALRERGGQGTVGPSFIQHYLVPLVYPDAAQGEMGRGLQVALGIALVAVNMVVYGLAWRQRRRTR